MKLKRLIETRKDGTNKIFSYNENENIMYLNWDDGEEFFSEYIDQIESQTYESYDIVEYDSKGNIIHLKDSYSEEKFEYDNKNRIIKYTCNYLEDDSIFIENYYYNDKLGICHTIGNNTDDGAYESWTKYDDNGNKIYFHDTENEYPIIWKYNDRDQVIYKQSPYGTKRWYEYYDE